MKERGREGGRVAKGGREGGEGRDGWGRAEAEGGNEGEGREGDAGEAGEDGYPCGSWYCYNHTCIIRLGSQAPVGGRWDAPAQGYPTTSPSSLGTR